MGRLYRIIFLLIAFIPTVAKAQTLDCEQTLALATEEFNAGHFYNVPSVLNDCLPKFNRDQRQRANLLLTQTYLLLDDPIGAQRSYLEVLAVNPEFVPDEQLHAIDIVYLSKRFTATPKFSWFVSAGTNVSPMRVILDLDVPAEDGKELYSLKPGYNFGLGGEYSYDDNIKLRLEGNFFNTSYKTQSFEYFDRDVKTLIDRQTWINIPVFLCYSDNIGTYRPYVYAGYSFSKMLTDKASISLEKVTEIAPVNDEGEVTFQTLPVTSPDLDFLQRRNTLNHSLLFGAGIKYKIGFDFVFAEVRYSAGLKNIVSEEQSLGNAGYDQTSGEWVNSFAPVSAYGHRDDYLRLDNLAITFGFLRPLYKPRELKRAKTKGILRKLKRAK